MGNGDWIRNVNDLLQKEIIFVRKIMVNIVGPKLNGSVWIYDQQHGFTSSPIVYRSVQKRWFTSKENNVSIWEDLMLTLKRVTTRGYKT